MKLDPNWPLPSFKATDWATAFCKKYPSIPEGVMIAWFANSLMRGFDEHSYRAAKKAPKPKTPKKLAKPPVASPSAPAAAVTSRVV